MLCNAVKACPETVGVINVSIRMKNQKIYSTISDNGPGLSMEEIGQILNPLDKSGNADL